MKECLESAQDGERQDIKIYIYKINKAALSVHRIATSNVKSFCGGGAVYGFATKSSLYRSNAECIRLETATSLSATRYCIHTRTQHGWLCP